MRSFLGRKKLEAKYIMKMRSLQWFIVLINYLSPNIGVENGQVLAATLVIELSHTIFSPDSFHCSPKEDNEVIFPSYCSKFFT